MVSSVSPFFVTDDITGASRNGRRDLGPFSGSSTGRVSSVSFTTDRTTGVVDQVTTITATSTGSSSPLYRFWVVTPSGQWTKPCGDYSPSNICRFTPNAAGIWQIAVSARDASSTAQYDATTHEQPYPVSLAW